MLSKLGVRFAKDLLTNLGIVNAEIIDAQSTNHTNKRMRHKVAGTYYQTADSIYIPIHLEQNREVLTQIPLKDNPKFQMDEGLNLKKVLEDSLKYVEMNQRTLDLDLENEFLIELVLRNKLEDKEQIIERANSLNFNLNKARHLIFIDIRNFKNRSREKQQERKIRDSLINLHQLLQQNIATYDEYAFYLYDDKFILLKEETENLHEELEQLNELSLKTLNLRLLFIVSEPCLEAEDYYMSFKKIHAFHRSYISKETIQPIFDIDDYAIELLLLGVSEEAREIFLHGKIKKLLELQKEQPDLIATFKVFYKCNLKTKETADVMYVHANTIYYRMQKLSEYIDLDVFLLTDAQRLYMALLLERV